MVSFLGRLRRLPGPADKLTSNGTGAVVLTAHHRPPRSPGTLLMVMFDKLSALC